MEKLERNLIDNILESEVKLGRASTPVTFYYPESSLNELLDCDSDGLSMAIAEFRRNANNHLGNVVIEELSKEKGRYMIKIPIEGLDWVHQNFKPSDFMKDFICNIRKTDNTLENISELFYRYSLDGEIKKIDEDEWAFSFRDEEIDPYVYHIEQGIFGLEYHRFTKESYKEMSTERKGSEEDDYKK